MTTPTPSTVEHHLLICPDCVAWLRDKDASSFCSCHVAADAPDACSCSGSAVRRSVGLTGLHVVAIPEVTAIPGPGDVVPCDSCQRTLRAGVRHYLIAEPVPTLPDRKERAKPDRSAWLAAASPGSRAAMSAVIDQQAAER